jgi:hypothetical protein
MATMNFQSRVRPQVEPTPQFSDSSGSFDARAKMKPPVALGGPTATPGGRPATDFGVRDLSKPIGAPMGGSYAKPAINPAINDMTQPVMRPAPQPVGGSMGQRPMKPYDMFSRRGMMR